MLPWIWSGSVERTVPSTRRASGVVNTSSVGMFATCLMPRDSSSAACQSRVGVQPDRQVGARPAVAELVEAPLVERRGARPGAASMCSRQAATGSGSSSRTACPTASQSRSTSGSPSTVSRPALVRVGDDRPVAEAVGQLQRLLGHLAHARLADALAVEVGEELGLGVAGDRAERAAGLAELAQPLDEPRRRVAEQRRRRPARCARAGRAGRSRGRRRSARRRRTPRARSPGRAARARAAR